jgi:hypothetical protein
MNYSATADITCDRCGRRGQRGFHRVVMQYPEPNKWFCDNWKACLNRELKLLDAKAHA